MSTNFLQILDDDSLIRLRGHVTFSPSDLMDGVNAVAAFDDLAQKLDLKVYDSPYEFDESKILALPQAKSWADNNDRRNCDVIFQALPGLTPVEATDERIWVSLCFNQFNDYTNVRWPLKSDPTSSRNAKDLTKSLLEHRFAGTARARWRNNSVSRLWWMAYYANSFDGLSATSALNVLCLDSDLVASFLGRPWTANNRLVAKHLLQELEKRYLNRDAPPFSRLNFRETLKEIDLRSGRLLLGSLDEGNVESLVHKIFIEKHGDM